MAGGNRKFRTAHMFGKKKRRPQPRLQSREKPSDSPALETADPTSPATASLQDAIATDGARAGRAIRVDTPFLSDADRTEIVARRRCGVNFIRFRHSAKAISLGSDDRRSARIGNTVHGASPNHLE